MILLGKRGWFLVGVCLAFAFVLASCKVGPPKGVTAFVIEDSTEFASAMLLYPKSEEYRLPLKLKYVDTNTFQTTASLAPGLYTLVVRTEMGRYTKIPVEIESGKQLYHVSLGPSIADESNASETTGQHKLRGKLYVSQGQMPSEVVAIFADRDIVVRRANVQSDGRFELEAPRNGVFWIELFAFTSDGKQWKWEKRIDLSKNQEVPLVALRALE
ncbi:MAG: hypothetical protein ACP5UB_00680 [Candidatus Sumerlaeaceae bacterium]